VPQLRSATFQTQAGHRGHHCRSQAHDKHQSQAINVHVTSSQDSSYDRRPG